MNDRHEAKCRTCSRLLVTVFVAWAPVLSGIGWAHDAAHAHPVPGVEYALSEQRMAVPDVVLIDTQSRPVPLSAAFASDEPLMVNFIFTSCGGICPVMTRTFSQVPAKLGEQASRLRMISISIDPENDTPQQLKNYAATYGAGPRWQFLTGTRSDVEAVQRAFDTYRGDKMNHAPLTFLRVAQDKPWLRIDGFASADDLAREYRTRVPR